jgi:hypothetical protein
MQQGPYEAGVGKRSHLCDAGKSGKTTATHQMQHERFGLVISLVSAQQPVP